MYLHPRANGAQPADIYGCLYFFLSHQLPTFARRLREFRISFRVVTTDASDLSRMIREDDFSSFGIPSSVRFDRIDVSNILDVNYRGIRYVLTHWCPLLKKKSDRSHSAIVQPDGRTFAAGPIKSAKIFYALVEKGRFPSLEPDSRISDPRPTHRTFPSRGHFKCHV